MKKPRRKEKIVSARPPSAEAERVWQNRLLLQMAVVETKAWADLGRYKFKNFGYWAAWWVKLNQMYSRFIEPPL